MVSWNVEHSLRALLFKKIYAAQPRLIRNDAKTAELVFKFVRAVESTFVSGIDGAELSWEDARELRFTIEPLLSLSEQTIRKYIAVLWRENSTIDLVKFDTEAMNVFDSRINY